MPSAPGTRQPRQRRPLQWTRTQLDVLAAVFEGRLSLDKIALNCAVASRTVDDWIAHPDFQAKLKEKRAKLLESLDAHGVIYHRVERRIIALSQEAELARQDFESQRFLRDFRPVPGPRPQRRERGRDERSEDDGYAGEPETPPNLPEGDARLPGVPPVPPGSYAINESYNRDALESFRGCLDDIAKELGDRKNQTQLSGSVDLREQILIVVPEMDDSADMELEGLEDFGEAPAQESAQ